MTVTTLDIQALVPQARHQLVFAVFESLVPGAKFIIVNDHDPRPLQRQLSHYFPDAFSWTYLESGPDTWRIEIARETAAEADVHDMGGCCGNCGCS